MRNFFLIPLTLFLIIFSSACTDLNTREIVDIVYPNESERYAVFVWHEPNGKLATNIFFGVGDLGGGKKSLSKIVQSVEPFGSADFSTSIVEYGIQNNREFVVCGARVEMLKIGDAKLFDKALTATNFLGGGRCNNETFASFPPPLIPASQDS